MRIWATAAAVLCWVAAVQDARSAGSAPAPAEVPAKGTYLVVYRPGPAWLAGKPIAEQPLKEHGRYILGLYEKGALKFAGPFTDDAGGAAVFDAANDEEAKAVVAADPAVKSGVFLGELHPWRLVDWAAHAARTAGRDGKVDARGPDALASPAPTGDEKELASVLSAYHSALQAGKPAEVTELLGPSFFMADERSSGGPERLGAHMFLTGPRLRSWPESFLKEVGPYRNDFRVVSVSVRRDAAVVLTTDTGSNQFRSWKDEEVAWFLGRVSAGWRIVGMVIRDIQLPRQP